MAEHVTVHYHEIALKGRNRSRFERVLRDNVARALPGAGVRPFGGRLLVTVDADADAAAERARRVCGVAHVVRVRRAESRDVEDVARAALADPGLSRATSFRITTRRADKSYPLNSDELNRRVGAAVHEATGLPVKLKGADLEIHVMVLPDAILVGGDKRPGVGGLPVGTGGRVAVLMSGGIDSPVAAWRMMRRGCRVDLVHFHSHPLVDKTTQEKARDLAEVLCEYQGSVRLWLVPLAEIQTQVRLAAPEALRVVLYRRFMVRIAERIARRRGCKALVTGESLGQVASQTLENLAAVDAVATMPILRPLIGMDKLEIIAEAERLGTYPISIRPDQDCCQLFIPRRPATRTTPRTAETAEAALDAAALVTAAQKAATFTDVGVLTQGRTDESVS